MTPAVFLFGRRRACNEPIEIASGKIAEHNAGIDPENLYCMLLQERDRNTEIIERIRDTMGKSADYEKRHAEQQRQIILLQWKRNA